MTYGYGGAPLGWPPPSEPDPPRGRRRAPDPDEGPGDEAGWPDGTQVDPAFQATPPPPVQDVPGRKSDREAPGTGRHAVGRAVPPGPPGPREPLPRGRATPGPRPPHESRVPSGQGALTDRYVPRRGSVYGTGRSGTGAPPAQPTPPPQPGPPPPQFGGVGAPAPQSGPFGAPAPQAGTARPFGAAAPAGQQPFPVASQYAPDRQFAPQRRPPARPEPAPERDRRLPASLWKSVLGGVVILALLVVVGVGALSLVNKGNAAAGPTPTHDISSQAVDPAPLTQAEVFPGPTVGATQSDAGYQVAKTEASADCKVAAVGDLPGMLAAQGCTQVVRATLVSADKAFVITTGLVNLRDQTGAAAVESAVKASVAGGKGRFNGLAAGGSTDVIAKVATQLGWDSRGHFLAYAVLARADGSTIAAGDPTATRIINALVEDYLKGTVLQARVDLKPASSPAAGQPATKPSTSKK